MNQTIQILDDPVIYLIIYEAKRQVEDVLRLLYAQGYESPIRLGVNNWATYSKEDNAEYHFDRYDSVLEYNYINSLTIVGSVKKIVDKEQIEKWKKMIV